MNAGTALTAGFQPSAKAESYRIETVGECSRCGELVNAHAFGTAVYHHNALRRPCRGFGEPVR
jgi:hypothetical protein